MWRRKAEWEYELEELLEVEDKKSDCEVIKNDFEDLFESINNCVDTAIDKNTTKLDVVGSLFGMGRNLLRLGFNGTVCAVKNAPKAVVTVANIKREITDTIEIEYQQHQKEIKEKELEDKILKLKNKQ